MARHRSPRVVKHWPLLVEMQGLIDSGVTRHGAAVMVADKNKRWCAITKGKYESAVWWLCDNHKKFSDELQPRLVVFEEMRAAREEWLSKLGPQERRRAERHHERELAILDAMRENQAAERRDYPEEAEERRRADFKAACRSEIEAMIRDNPEMVLAMLRPDA
jgi:hypothetical protein